MTENNNNDVYNEIVEETDVKELSLFQRIKNVFTNPVAAMEDISKKPKVLVPLIIVSVIFLILLLLRFNLFKEFTIEQLRLNIAKSSPGVEPTDQAINMALWMALIVTTLAPLVMLLFKSLIAHGIANLLDGKGKFKATFSVVVFSYFIQTLGEIIRAIIGLATGEYMITTSLAVFLPSSSMRTPLYSVLSGIEVFGIWYLIVSLIGISIVHKISRTKAGVAVFIPWIIMLGLSAVAGLL